MMPGFLKEIFQPINNHKKTEHFNEEQKVQLASCTLFIEMAKADSDFSHEEYKKISTIMQKMFALSSEQVHELMELAEEWIARSISIYEFTKVINKYFSPEEKYELVKNLWKIIYADKVLDKYEDHLVKIVSNNLNLAHKDMIAAKLTVKKEFGL